MSTEPRTMVWVATLDTNDGAGHISAHLNPETAAAKLVDVATRWHFDASDFDLASGSENLDNDEDVASYGVLAVPLES